MDISKMYCRVDSEHFDEFVNIIKTDYNFDTMVVDMFVGTLVGKSRACLHLDGNVLSCAGIDCYLSGEYTEFTGTWSIYNNTLPMSDLTDEQAAELFNWWRNGGEVEFVEECGEWVGDDPLWGNKSVYRAKQKTERELFIDKCNELGSDFGKMFDNGARFTNEQNS